MAVGHKEEKYVLDCEENSFPATATGADSTGRQLLELLHLRLRNLGYDSVKNMAKNDIVMGMKN